MKKREYHAGWDWFCQQPIWAQLDAAYRHSVLEFVRAYQEIGLSRSASISEAARHFRLKPRTIYRWFSLINGVHPIRMAQLVYLCPRGGRTAVYVRGRRYAR